jgi:DNA-binding response OmpR family regulator
MTVFFVDDDIDDREFFVDALSYVDPAIKCILAKDCEDALRLLDASEEKPGYIFLDINMPRLGGKDCLCTLRNRQQLRDMKVVMYSNTSDEQLMKEYKELGATYFLVKPSTFNGLCDSLSVMFGK